MLDGLGTAGMSGTAAFGMLNPCGFLTGIARMPHSSHSSGPILARSIFTCFAHLLRV